MTDVLKLMFDDEGARVKVQTFVHTTFDLPDAAFRVERGGKPIATEAEVVERLLAGEALFLEMIVTGASVIESYAVDEAEAEWDEMD